MGGRGQKAEGGNKRGDHVRSNKVKTQRFEEAGV